MAHGHYEDAVTTLSRKDAQQAREDAARREDRRTAAAEARRGRRSI